MTNFGLALIVFAWAYQAWRLLRGNKMIQPVFVGLYALGVLFLIISNSAVGALNFVSLDGLSFLLALAVLALILMKK
jgi:hypothetical protein